MVSLGIMKYEKQKMQKIKSKELSSLFVFIANRTCSMPFCLAIQFHRSSDHPVDGSDDVVLVKRHRQFTLRFVCFVIIRFFFVFWFISHTYHRGYWPLEVHLVRRSPSAHSFSMSPAFRRQSAAHPVWNRPFQNWKWCRAHTPKRGHKMKHNENQWTFRNECNLFFSLSVQLFAIGQMIRYAVFALYLRCQSIYPIVRRSDGLFPVLAIHYHFVRLHNRSTSWRI